MFRKLLVLMCCVFAVLATVSPCLAITVDPIPPFDGYLNTQYKFSIDANTFGGNADGKTLKMNVTSGSLPPGLSLSFYPNSKSTNAMAFFDIEGTPTKAGKYVFTVTATGSGERDSRTFCITIAPYAMTTEPVIETRSVIGFIKGKKYDFRFDTADHMRATWSIVNPNYAPAPAGMTFPYYEEVDGVTYPVGALQGTPTQTGTFSMSMTCGNVIGYTWFYPIAVVKDANNIPAAPKISTQSLSQAKTNELYRVQLSVEGNDPVDWIVKSGSLPGGLTLSSNGLIYGTPTATGNFTFTVDVTNGFNSSQKQFTINVAKGADQPVYVAPVITTTSLPAGKVNKPYNFTVSATGTAPISFRSTSLPAGLSINSEGVISGIPEQKGTWRFHLIVSNAGGASDKEFSMVIGYADSDTDPDPDPEPDPEPEPDSYDGGPDFKTDSLKNAKVNKSYTISLKATGDKPITWTAQNLPDGLELTSKGKFKGAPSALGTYKIGLIATNPKGSTKRTMTLTVDNDKPKAAVKITSKFKRIGYYYEAVFSSKTGTGITWSLEGDLPAGLSFDAATGVLSGIPTEGWKESVTATAKNSEGESSKKLKVNIQAEKPKLVTPKIPKASVPAVGRAFSFAATLTGSQPINVQVTNLPPGLSYDYVSADGTINISGTPTSGGKYKAILEASNAGGKAKKNLTLTVETPPSINAATLPHGTRGKNYKAKITASGSKPITWELRNNYYTGISINAKSGQITGKPQYAFSNLTLVVIATNPYGTDTKSFDLTVDPAPYNSRSSGENLVPDDVNSTPQELPELGGIISPDDYVIAAELGTVSTDISGMHDFSVTLSGDIPAGAALIWLANSSDPSDDDNIAEFFDEEGREISCVPESRKITVSVWLNEGRVYNPVIAVKNLTNGEIALK
ncbi:MAG: putative Ig domain-containing protein [Synergistaceae bacterium]|nr:putative Ig domain-containing protein [Synergistaceae bacterium]